MSRTSFVKVRTRNKIFNKDYTRTRNNHPVNKQKGTESVGLNILS